jgi:signal transduction histidine kinase
VIVEPRPASPAPFEPADWSDASARGLLQLIAESVAQMVGFEVAVISAVQDDDVIVSVAIEGDDDVRTTLRGMRTPLATIRDELALAQDWGRFKFVDHELVDPDDEFRWVPDIEQGEGPDAWHPLDALLAPLYTEDGDLCGLLSIDLPLSGQRPDPTQLGLLERYAAQAERALRNAFERDALEQRLRLAEAAREVVGFAVSQADVEAALDECRPALLEGFRADDLRIRTYSDELVGAGGSPPTAVSDALRAELRRVSRRCWEQQRVGVMVSGRRDEELIAGDLYDETLAAVERLGYTSTMLVPIGAGRRSLGHLILFRTDPAVPWTPDERVGALEVARDIGQAVLSSRNLAREQRLVGELRELDRYKTQLLSTVSHELKNPLGAIAGHLELVAATPGLSEDTTFSVGAMSRATARLTRVVDDLLTLARLEDPEGRPASVALDVRPAVEAALESTQFAAERRGLELRLDAPDGALQVLADREGLVRVLTNLVSNAVKYSRRGGTVTVCMQRREQHGQHGEHVEIAVVDEGIGISPADREQLFTEFFRSTNPAALSEPGTGLGLAISARIVAGHGGRITVDSELGSGSTFRVQLRAPAAVAGARS